MADNPPGLGAPAAGQANTNYQQWHSQYGLSGGPDTKSDFTFLPAGINAIDPAQVGISQGLDLLTSAYNAVWDFIHTNKSVYPRALLVLIDAALAVEQLKPVDLSSLITALDKAGGNYADAHTTANNMLKETLPAVWEGSASQTAARSIGALAASFDNGSTSLKGAAAKLRSWSQAMPGFIARDGQGIADLRNDWTTADKSLSDSYNSASVAGTQQDIDFGNSVLGHIGERVKAFEDANKLVTDTINELNKYAGAARAGQIADTVHTKLDAISEELIAYSGPKGYTDTDTTIPLAKLGAASAAFAGLKPTDYNTFIDLLDHAKTSTDKAVLYGALANGESVPDIAKKYSYTQAAIV